MVRVERGWCVLMIAALLLAVTVMAAPAMAGEKIVIKAGHVLAPTEPTHLALVEVGRAHEGAYRRAGGDAGLRQLPARVQPGHDGTGNPWAQR